MLKFQPQSRYGTSEIAPAFSTPGIWRIDASAGSRKRGIAVASG
jgi:hypothetical protein